MVVEVIGSPAPNASCVEIFEYMLAEAKAGRITAASVACVGTENSYYTQYGGHNTLELLAPIALLSYRILEEKD